MSQTFAIHQDLRKSVGRGEYEQKYTVLSNDIILPEHIKQLRQEGKISQGQGYHIGIQYVREGDSPSTYIYEVTITNYIDSSD